MSDLTTCLKYKGYEGSIEIDFDENILYGHVQNLDNPNDMVTYEGETIKELREDFEGAIDFYLSTLNEEALK
ncbi:hypothetical protein [Butyrivibrio sp. XPD2006]|uniref:hypothetical protein n=1 Tax=Butyrivibrio sp. XPD2006 TaxID=1280668 RepID=UPI0004294740|nr:hypothetical protein [Butyrivibrio sp. XPD2006]